MHRHRERVLMVVSLILLDSLMICTALLLAYFVRISSGLIPYGAPYHADIYLTLTAVAIPLWLSVFALARLYDPTILLGGPVEYGQVFKGCSFGTLMLIALSFLWRQMLTFSRGWLLLAWVFSVVLVGGTRFLFRRLIYWLRQRHGLFVTRLLIVGANEQGVAMARQWDGSSGVKVVGFVDDFVPPGTRVVGSLEVMGPPKHLSRIVREQQVSEVVMVPNAVAWDSFTSVVRQGAQPNGFDVRLSPGFYELLTTDVGLIHRGFVPLLTLKEARVTGIDAGLKGALDYIGGALLLLLSIPLQVVLAVGLKLTAPRCPLFSAPRVHGRGGRFFTTFKFDTESKEGTSSIGISLRRFLHNTGLDKLPQLANVLLGQMSLVGPRTVSSREEKRYGHWLLNLLTVKPGLTGPWAIKALPSLEDEIRANMYYIRNWTIWLDFQVIFRTIMRIVRRRRPTVALPVLNQVGLDGLPRLDVESETY